MWLSTATLTPIANATTIATSTAVSFEYGRRLFLYGTTHSHRIVEDRVHVIVHVSAGVVVHCHYH